MGGFSMISETIECILELASIYSCVIVSTYIGMRVLRIDDFAIEGSFSLGGAMSAWCIISNVHPIVAILIAILSGAAIGWITGLIHTKLGVSCLISGLVITGAIFSINLAFVGPCVSLTKPTIYDLLGNHIPHQHVYILLLAAFTSMSVASWVFGTEIGLCLRACGENPLSLVHIGKSPSFYKIFGLVLANSLSAFAGSLMIQHTGIFSISGCSGTLILAIAGLMVGEIVSSRFWIVIPVGAILYQIIVSLSLELQCNPVWTKFISSSLIVITMLSKHLTSRSRRII
jgi:putative ABC transport system permease protein